MIINHNELQAFKYRCNIIGLVYLSYCVHYVTMIFPSPPPLLPPHPPPPPTPSLPSPAWRPPSPPFFICGPLHDETKKGLYHLSYECHKNVQK